MHARFLDWNNLGMKNRSFSKIEARVWV